MPLTVLSLFYIIVALWSGCFSTWVNMLTRGKVDPRIWTDCKLYYFMFYFGRQYSSMLLVLMSIEKCFAVYFPLKSKSVCTLKTAKWGHWCCWVYSSQCTFLLWHLANHLVFISVEPRAFSGTLLIL